MAARFIVMGPLLQRTGNMKEVDVTGSTMRKALDSPEKKHPDRFVLTGCWRDLPI